MDKNFTAILLLIAFTLPILEQYLLDSSVLSQIPLDPPSGYVFNSLGTISYSGIPQMQYAAQSILLDRQSPQEIQYAFYIKSFIPAEVK